MKKGNCKERTAAGAEWLDESYKKETTSKEVYRVKKHCVKAGKNSRKKSTSAQDQAQGAAGGGNIVAERFFLFVKLTTNDVSFFMLIGFLFADTPAAFVFDEVD